MNIPFRTDKYRLSLWSEVNGKEKFIADINSPDCNTDIINAKIKIQEENSVIKITSHISVSQDLSFDRLFIRLGIDCYMKRFPEWNDKFFPTLIRCEKQGVWGCFMSPDGIMAAVASPDTFVSWKNEYERKFDVGHRIYTVSLDILNIFKQPDGHPKPNGTLLKGEHCYSIYIKTVANEEELYSFAEAYSGIKVCRFEKYTLEQWEKPKPLFDEEYNLINTNGRCVVEFQNSNAARTRLFYRRAWSYYLECAAKHAGKCQQKSGSHTESWYGYFTMAEYARYIHNKEYTEQLIQEFDAFYKFNTNRFTGKLKKRAYPSRLQNISCMISLLVSFYQLTDDVKYLDQANILSRQLIAMQKKDGAFYSHTTHYTCVIYPAKSMLDLALSEKNAGLESRYMIHYESAKKAVMNLAELLDNIETEGDMTFEDGMISCEALQLAYFALHTDDISLRKKLTDAAEYIIKKHKCLEQIFAPDARIRGCTLRFWEARYDINFNSNMLNSPHGWTSWKTYATYYLYLLTGNSAYLRDTMDTMGACVQCIDDNGVLNWAYIPDPCIRGKLMVPSNSKRGYDFKEVVVGEEYLPTVSDWYKCNPKRFVFQYIGNFNRLPKKLSYDYGGSCDNDVNEHFKCMAETVLGKAFIHLENNNALLYGCRKQGDNYISDGDIPDILVAFTDQAKSLVFNGVSYTLNRGINFIYLEK